MLFIVIFFVYGLVIGSFLNVVIYRLPHGISLSYPASHCPYCQTKLKIRDLMPVLSFLLVRGRCRYCHKPIRLRYILVELGTGLFLAALYMRSGLSIISLVVALMGFTLISSAFIVYDEHPLPTKLLVFMGFFIIVKQFLQPLPLMDWLGTLVLASILFLYRKRQAKDFDTELLLLCTGLFTGFELFALLLLLSWGTSTLFHCIMYYSLLSWHQQTHRALVILSYALFALLI